MMRTVRRDGRGQNAGHLAAWVALVLAAGCSSSGSSGPTDAGNPAGDAGPLDASGDGPTATEAGVDGATGDAGAGGCNLVAPPPSTPCSSFTSPAPLSCALAAWPAFPAFTATDLTAMANVTTTAVNGEPAGVLLSPDGTTLFDADRVASTSGELSVLARAGDALTLASFHYDFSTSPTIQYPFGLAVSPDGTMLAVGLTDRISFFDVASLEAHSSTALIAAVDTPLTGPNPSTLDVTFSIDGSLCFGANEYESQVSVVNVKTMTYVGAIPVASNAVTSVVVSPDGKYLYVTSEVANAFATTAEDAGSEINADQDVGSITIVDVATAASSPATAVLGQIFVGRAPVRTILSADGSTAWVTARGSNALIALDATKFLTDPACALLSETPVGQSPVGHAFIAGGAGIAVANSFRFENPVPNGTIMIVNTAAALAGSSGAVKGQITVGQFPREMTADATSLFVSDFDSMTISGIDLQNVGP
jgi:DNA-binding beta-propeller fold protein YncE